MIVLGSKRARSDTFSTAVRSEAGEKEAEDADDEDDDDDEEHKVRGTLKSDSSTERHSNVTIVRCIVVCIVDRGEARSIFYRTPWAKPTNQNADSGI